MSRSTEQTSRCVTASPDRSSGAESRLQLVSRRLLLVFAAHTRTRRLCWPSRRAPGPCSGARPCAAQPAASCAARASPPQTGPRRRDSGSGEERPSSLVCVSAAYWRRATSRHVVVCRYLQKGVDSFAPAQITQTLYVGRTV